MAVNDVRNPVHIIQRCQRCFCEIAIFRDIVDQIGVRISVAEEFLVIDEIIHNTVPDILHDSYIEGSAVSAKCHIERSTVNHFLLIFPRNAFITGKDDLNVTVLFYQCLRQCVHNIAQTTGLNKGIALGTDEYDTLSGSIAYFCLRFFCYRLFLCFFYYRFRRRLFFYFLCCFCNRLCLCFLCRFCYRFCLYFLYCCFCSRLCLYFFYCCFCSRLCLCFLCCFCLRFSASSGFRLLFRNGLNWCCFLYFFSCCFCFRFSAPSGFQFLNSFCFSFGFLCRYFCLYFLCFRSCRFCFSGSSGLRFFFFNRSCNLFCFGFCLDFFDLFHL